MSDDKPEETPERDPYARIPTVEDLRREEVNSQYGETYFDGGPATPGYDKYEDSWLWAPVTEIMVHLLGPGAFLDWGCAKGYLVQRFVERGVNAVGVDVSKYAVGQATPWVRESRLHVINGLQTCFGNGLFETVCSFETMEHIPEEELPRVIQEMRRVSKRWWFGSIFIEGQTSDDPTHVTVRPRKWWNELFKEHGYRIREDIAQAAMEYPVFRTFGFQVFCFEQIPKEG